MFSNRDESVIAVLESFVCTIKALPTAVTGRGWTNSFYSNLIVEGSPESAPLHERGER